MSRTRPKLTAPSTTATTPTAAMLGGPLLCTREPTHSANSGPPVQMLMVVRLIAQTSAMRSTRMRRPPGRGVGSLVSFTCVIQPQDGLLTELRYAPFRRRPLFADE